MMHVIIVGFSGAIAMNLTICIKQIELAVEVIRSIKQK